MPATGPSPAICHHLGLRQAMRHVGQHYDAHLAPVGLKTTQFSILARLHHHGPSSINALAEAMVMDRTTMGRNLRPLEQAGLVEIGQDPEDARRRVLRLTAAGEARLATARPLWAAAQRGFEAAYGAEASATLRRVLAAVVATEFPSPARTPKGPG